MVSKSGFACSIELQNDQFTIELKTTTAVERLTLRVIGEDQLDRLLSLGHEIEDCRMLFPGSCDVVHQSDKNWKFKFDVELKHGQQLGQICYYRNLGSSFLGFDLLGAKDFVVPLALSQVVEAERVFRLAARCRALGLREQFGTEGTL
jgi:hypothetical protein